ncbi:glycosyltransferase family 2 protein [Paenibacillus crassostreae]|uniref:Glycosyl transferase n=1 Tax=Paenibacillus crassostreae TaxID=1763538 RepID=A0A167BDA2_9BACL|nr:glycosyltransferase family A protein [Paenibacillus crassostreae]AOZ92943.1 glycosyl transferase [Paenibacillus crassostreae]OAB71968.1 glycosyl transferase [Paenibacillus crassostreae]
MKLLSVVIPCYNSQEYMRVCIESLLPGSEEVELLIINDGSVDETAEIADDYARKFPTIVKVIHQKNGGHGEAVNAGIRNATGMFFKVVDSDDWVDIKAYEQVLRTLRGFVEENNPVDMIISNFVYEKEGTKYKKVMKYEDVLPENVIFSWDDTEYFGKGQYLMMHSIIYRTQLLRDCRLELPKHTFYVDNLYVYKPLAYVEKIYYLNVDFYRYFIGREDQSVNESVMIARIDQQVKVNKLMIEEVRHEEIGNAKLRRYLLHHLEIVTVISAILLIRSGTKGNLQKKKELLQYIKERDSVLYHQLRYGLLGNLIHLPGRFGRSISIGAYKVSQKIIGFN